MIILGFYHQFNSLSYESLNSNLALNVLLSYIVQEFLQFTGLIYWRRYDVFVFKKKKKIFAHTFLCDGFVCFLVNSFPTPFGHTFHPKNIFFCTNVYACVSLWSYMVIFFLTAFINKCNGLLEPVCTAS